ncbi:hypothetical protein HUT18_24585 [Streptomyces sp. NA04227]|uniref:endo-beta-N-acetylglucosaminidase n=1 Tax=Streptomyces sp. NA04227 TaxID=2742136 RepID=UPI0015909414|nr:hypothetical protein [Streptomyces sp. NA04227]QKW09085.1 hypothetical protein HUT18_24585 [Streptomyces sp. NA04227]
MVTPDTSHESPEPQGPGPGSLPHRPLDRRAFLRLLTAAGVTVSLAGTATLAGPWVGTALADVEEGRPRAPHQPYLHGYNAAGLLSWTPESDPYAKYFRSRVPLATRIAPFAATQANPALRTEARVMNMSYDYDNAFFSAYRSNDQYARRLLRFWQYSDLYSSWHGMPVWGSPTEEPEHGLINLPNPAYTDAAHRNGVLSLGGWFWPRSGEFAAYLEQRTDGSFPVADKLLEIADYFGFDGYFVNQEAAIPKADATRLMAFLTYLRTQAPDHFHMQWYDSLTTSGQLDYQNEFNEANAPWLEHDGQQVNHSIFINYAWNAERVANSVATAEKLGMDVHERVHLGTENEKYGFNPPYDTRLVFPEGGRARTSWALFGTHMAWANNPDRSDPDKQRNTFVRERHYWSGPNEDPTRTGRTEYEPWPDDGKPRDADNHRKWDGVAHYITERSVIGAFPFVTRFNTGHGRAFFLDGVRRSGAEWNNAGAQDILPTWQWWVRSGGSEPPLTVDYDHTVAYDGGTSLLVSGTLGPENPTTVRLFKTELPLGGGESARLVLRTGRARQESGLSLGLAFRDAPEEFVWLPAGRTGSGDWTTVRLPLDAHAGRTIAAVAIRAAAPSGSTKRSAYRLNLGELAFLPAGTPTAPAAPTGFRVDAVHPATDRTSAELFLSWHLDRTGVWYYDVLRERADGSPEPLGRVYDEVHYVKSLVREGEETSTVLRLVAVGRDGERSEGATARVDWT